jgi:hypothetical protein
VFCQTRRGPSSGHVFNSPVSDDTPVRLSSLHPVILPERSTEPELLLPELPLLHEINPIQKADKITDTAIKDGSLVLIFSIIDRIGFCKVNNY